MGRLRPCIFKFKKFYITFEILPKILNFSIQLFRMLLNPFKEPSRIRGNGVQLFAGNLAKTLVAYFMIKMG